ncbi:universal stress protein [Brunnivagina elsteri]|uniref:Universal stress protein UspA-like protein n=1 Tax=Brunnivagina elsteri CCALA 953 TaxID=987040 RepID=A0A2A2TJ13_9CYAN|nr:universal stress protein [Calothrix elsteri]PAX54321.1 universal stress protein UspA-like protein [Calothrix elsteri CCALA 953]
MFEKVLICTDFSDGLHRFGHFVSSLAVAGIKQIVFLHTVPLWEKGIIPQVDTEKVEQAQTLLAEVVNENSTDVTVKIEVQSGKPVETILKIAQNYESELIVLGSQGHSRLSDKLLGSTMAELCKRSPIPLLLLRPQLISAYTAEELTLRCQHLFRSLLLPYDGSEVASYLVQKVKHQAEKQSGRYLQQCVLCWIVKDLKDSQARETLSQVKADLETANLQVEINIRQGQPVVELLEAAKMIDISAIAVSSGTLGTFREWLVSSVAGEILSSSWHPVLFFPAQR